MNTYTAGIGNSEKILWLFLVDINCDGQLHRPVRAL